MQNQDKTYLFEEAPIPSTVARLAVPTILSSLVMVLYNLADTYFVGMLAIPSRTPPSPWRPRSFWPSTPSTTCSAWAPPA